MGSGIPAPWFQAIQTVSNVNPEIPVNVSTTVVVAATTSKRELAGYIIAGLITLCAAIGTLPADSKDIPLPPEWRPYIISAGFFAATAERWLKVIYAWSKNLKVGNIGGLPLALFACLLLFPSCALEITEDGCLLGKYNRNNVSYAAGPCMGPNSEINRYRVQWSNDDGQKLRATYWVKDKRPVLVEYFTGTIWLQWSSKSGVVIGPLPPEVQKALEGKPEPIFAPKITETLAPEIPV